MTGEQKYLFDLQGYIVLKDVIPEHVIAACNVVLDRFENMPPADYPPPLCLGTERTEKELYISNILEADSALNPLVDIPEVLDVIQGVTGGPYRLNHTYTIYRWGGGTPVYTCTECLSFRSVNITAEMERWCQR